jgi:hypothetical protein
VALVTTNAHKTTASAVLANKQPRNPNLDIKPPMAGSPCALAHARRYKTVNAR